jgi:hypothetical protein
MFARRLTLHETGRYDADEMTRTQGWLLTLVVFAGCVLALAATNPAIGVWQVVSTGAEDLNWTLTVKEEGGKLTGTLAGDVGEFGLVDPKVEGDAFTFKIVVNEDTYAVETKVYGNKLVGTYKGPDMSGSVKGTRQ